MKMASEFITPIQVVGSLSPLSDTKAAVKAADNENGSVFKDIFQNAIKDVTDTQANLETQQYLLSTGQIDDAHTVPIAASEAQLAVDMLVQLRNKAVESYNELIRINV